MDINALQGKALEASRFLKAMSNKHRLMILCNLIAGEHSVGELERIVGLSQSALSQHLARLRKEELVKTRREAQTIFYSLNDDSITEVLQVLYNIYCTKSDDLAQVA